MTNNDLAFCAFSNRPVGPHDGPQWTRWRRRMGEYVSLNQGSRVTPFSDAHEQLPEADRTRIHYDFLVGSDGRPWVYLLTPDRFTRYRPVPHDMAPHTNRFVPDGEFTPGWDGPFYVYADGADRHFVTVGGRIYSLFADAKHGSALTLTREGDPVLALVHDTDSGKAYAFTRTHYFHITAKPDPRPHGLKAFSGATAEEALDTVAKCGRVIRGLK